MNHLAKRHQTMQTQIDEAKRHAIALREQALDALWAQLAQTLRRWQQGMSRRLTQAPRRADKQPAIRRIHLQRWEA